LGGAEIFLDGPKLPKKKLGAEGRKSREKPSDSLTPFRVWIRIKGRSLIGGNSGQALKSRPEAQRQAPKNGAELHGEKIEQKGRGAPQTERKEAPSAVGGTRKE